MIKHLVVDRVELGVQSVKLGINYFSADLTRMLEQKKGVSERESLRALKHWSYGADPGQLPGQHHGVAGIGNRRFQ